MPSDAVVVGYVSVQPFEKCRAMPKGRVESFSDCVIAFAITLLILDIHLKDVGTKTNSAGMIHAFMALATLKPVRFADILPPSAGDHRASNRIRQQRDIHDGVVFIGVA